MVGNNIMYDLFLTTIIIYSYAAFIGIIIYLSLYFGRR
jgi:hypothetical protein